MSSRISCSGRGLTISSCPSVCPRYISSRLKFVIWHEHNIHTHTNHIGEVRVCSWWESLVVRTALPTKCHETICGAKWQNTNKAELLPVRVIQVFACPLARLHSDSNWRGITFELFQGALQINFGSALEGR